MKTSTAVLLAIGLYLWSQQQPKTPAPKLGKLGPQSPKR
jgi:hypothetical protein